MATVGTTASNGKTKVAAEPGDMAQKAREQLISTIQKSQQVSVDAAQTWAQVLSVLPVQNLSKMPWFRTLPSLETTTRFVFDVAADLLNAQRDYALKLVSLFGSRTSA